MQLLEQAAGYPTVPTLGSDELCYHRLKTQQTCTVRGTFGRQEQSPSADSVFSMHTGCRPEFTQYLGEFDRLGSARFTSGS